MQKTGVEKVGGKYVAFLNGKEVGSGVYKYQADKALAAAQDQVVFESEALATPINTRFAFVSSLVRMVAKKQTPSVVLCGEGGLGKSYTVYKALEELGYTASFLEDAGKGKRFVVIKGFSTARGLYIALYENKDSIVLLDDCDAALRDPDSINILKGALDSTEKRVVSWNSSKDDDIPRSFLFTGGVIAISNTAIGKIDQAIRSRSMCVDLAMTLSQKIERMGAIIESDEFMPTIEKKIKRSALALIDQNKAKAKEISLRSLIKVSNALASGEADAEELAKYILLQG